MMVIYSIKNYNFTRSIKSQKCSVIIIFIVLKIIENFEYCINRTTYVLNVAGYQRRIFVTPLRIYSYCMKIE